MQHHYNQLFYVKIGEGNTNLFISFGLCEHIIQTSYLGHINTMTDYLNRSINNVW